MSYYVNQLSTLGKISLTENPIDRRINWVFGDYQLNRYSNHKEFIKNNENYIIVIYLMEIKNVLIGVQMRKLVYL